MASFATRLRSAIYTAAAAVDEITRLVLGDPSGADVHVEGVFDARQPGMAWQPPGSATTLLVDQLGSELDKHSVSWAAISTAGTGVSPALGGSYGITGATKNEISNQLTLTISPAYDSSAYAIFALTSAGIVLPPLSVSTSSATLSAAGGVNNLIVYVLIFGQR